MKNLTWKVVCCNTTGIACAHMNQVDVYRSVRFIKAPQHAGLNNLVFTCYMNCVLQCLASCAPLCDYFVQGRYTQDVWKVAATCFRVSCPRARPWTMCWRARQWRPVCATTRRFSPCCPTPWMFLSARSPTNSFENTHCCSKVLFVAWMLILFVDYSQ